MEDGGEGIATTPRATLATRERKAEAFRAGGRGRGGRPCARGARRRGGGRAGGGGGGARGGGGGGGGEALLYAVFGIWPHARPHYNIVYCFCTVFYFFLHSQKQLFLLFSRPQPLFFTARV